MCMVLPCVTQALLSTAINFNSIQIPEGIKLANRFLNEYSATNLLIIMGVFWKLVDDNRIRLPSGPCLQCSKLGWLISGPVISQ